MESTATNLNSNEVRNDEPTEKTVQDKDPNDSSKSFIQSINLYLSDEVYDKAVEGHFKDYETLLEHCFNLMKENKELLSENRDLHRDHNVIVKMHRELNKENKNMKEEKKKLVEDSLSMIDYHHVLTESKMNLEEQLKDIKVHYSNLLDSLATGISKELEKLGNTDDEDDDVDQEEEEEQQEVA